MPPSEPRQVQRPHSAWINIGRSTTRASPVDWGRPRGPVVGIQRTRICARKIQQWKVFGGEAIVLVMGLFCNKGKHI